LQLAQALENHSKVRKVRYPFLPSHPHYKLAKKQMKAGGNIVTIEIDGDLQTGRNFLDAIAMCSLTANLGDSRTIVSHPASTTHAKLTREERDQVGISDSLIRISVGLEHVDDIKGDIIKALDSL